MKLRSILTWCLVTASVFSATAQNIDSLKLLLKNAAHDTTKCKLLGKLIDQEPDQDVWSKYNEELKTLAESKLQTEVKGKPLYRFYLKYKAIAIGNRGFICIETGDLRMAKTYFLESLEIEKELGDKRRLASSYSNLGQAYSMQGDIVNALKFSEKALFMYEELKDQSGISVMLNNLAVVFEGQGDTEKALDYALRALKITQKTGDKKSIADSYSNVGYLYKIKGDLDKAMEYYEFALSIREEMKDKQGISISLNNIGRLFEKKKDYNKALNYFERTLKIEKETGDKDGIGSILNNMGNIYSTIGDLTKALEYSSKSLEIAREVGSPGQILRSASVLKGIYVKQNNYAMAFKMQDLFYQMKDSINNKETRSAAIKNQLRYEYGKKAIADSIKALEEKTITDLEIKSQQAQISQEKTLRYALYLGLAIFITFSGFIYNRFQITKKQKAIIDIQKQEVVLQKSIIEEKQKEIVDSINYAKRLQDAIMPTQQAVNEQFSDNFIFYKPKDIVAGDFYWMGIANDLVHIAAADCTGHGVPGALVSMVCSNALDRSVFEFGMKEPGAILDKTRELVIKTFEKSSQEVKDGMDVSLCTFNIKTNELQWAGANNPLWVMQVNQQKTMIELKADKQSVGKVDNAMPFKTHKLKLEKGDLIYLFTDGYADQFGGVRGKKFKYKQLQELVHTISELPMVKQMKVIEKKFDEWKNELEQVDDILIIGIRI